MTNKSNCQNRREAITALVLGELDPQAVDELKEHIEGCETCRCLYQGLSDEEQTIRSTFAAIVDRGQAIQQDLVQKSGKQPRQASTGPVSLRSSSIFKNRTARLATAAVIILAAGIGIAVLSTSFVPDVGPGERVAMETKLEAELEQIEQMFAAHDVAGLERMLLEGEFGSKVAAANYLAEIGDSNSVAILEQLDEQYGSSEPVFAEAIEAIEAAAEADGTQVDESDTNSVEVVGAPTQGSDEILQLVPAESLFCVRVNNLDGSVGLIDQYLTGVSPSPVGAAMLARMQLAGLLGDPTLSGVNTAGNFAVFAVALAGESTGGPMDNIFIAGLIPVVDYEKFVSSNPNCEEPDANGVSIIKSGGDLNADKKMLVTKSGTYALIGSQSNYDKLLSIAKAISQGSPPLGGSLDVDRLQAAKTEPIWAYIDIQRASKVFGPMVEAQLEKMKKQLETMEAGPQGGPAPAAAMNMYFGMLDILTEEVESFTISLNPKADVFNLTTTVAAVPQTYLAKMFVADTSGKTNTLLGYLEDGAIVNLGIKVNTPFMEELSLTNYDFISFLSDEGISDETLARLEKVIADIVSSAAGPGVMSFAPSEQDWPSFTGKYVIEIEDADRWNNAIEAAIDLWKTGGLIELYREMGMETRYEIERGAQDYKDVSIDVVKFVMEANDPNSAYGEMIDKVYGGGFEFRVATVDRTWLSVFGADCNSAIRELIDQVKAGGPQQTPPEVASALAVLAGPENADFVGTANVMRYLNMAATMLREVPIQSAGPPIVPVDIVTNSNIAFAGKVTNGKIAVEIALPKQHLLEVKAGLETMQQQVAAIMARRQAIAQLPLSEGTDRTMFTDYAVARDANTSDEELAIEGLRTYAEISNGRYPSSLDLKTIMKDTGEALQRSLIDDPNTPLTQEEVMPKVMQIEAASVFYDKLVKDGNDVTYYGAVTTEFAHSVLMYWKASEGKYRVIFADLAAETVGEERLAELQAMPLNLAPEAIKPDPADGKMAGTISNLKLRWMPGLDATAHRVYLGSRAEELSLLAEVTTEACDELPELQTDSVYYWRVDEVQADDSVVVGDVWSFNTGKLCGWWRFDEESGIAAADSSGNAYHGTVVSGKPVWEVDGRFGGCLNFDETYGVSIPGGVFGNHIATEMTISVWIKGNPNQLDHSNVILQAGSGSTGRPYIVSVYTEWQDNGLLEFKTGHDETDQLSFNASPDQWAGRWNHYALVKNANEGFQRVYLNGDLVAEKTGAKASMAGVSTARIGIAPDRFGDQYIGKLDDLRIYNYALSQDEIGQIHSGAEPALAE
jgi:hypothetical protein